MSAIPKTMRKLPKIETLVVKVGSNILTSKDKGVNLDFLSGLVRTLCEIKKNRKDSLNDLFKRFYANPQKLDFDKTEVAIKLYTIGRACISRSQARRVLSGLTKFKKIILDFKNVKTVGQGFVDEIFRIFVKQNPKIEIKAVNMNKSVEFMVKRGKHTKLR